MHTGLFLVLSFFVPVILTQNSTPPCKELVDVVAVIDGSDSISYENFQTLKDFLKKLVNELHIVQGETRLGLILYSSDITTTIQLSDDRSVLLQQIATLQHARDGTNTALGLAAMNIMFANYSRPGVPKVGIVITDGNSKDSAATLLQAEASRNAQISMFAVGVTNKVNSTELQGIASTGSQVVTVESFTNLSRILKKIVLRSCPDQCKDYLEVVALVDGSDSISSEDFIKLKSALFGLVEDINVSPNRTRLGIILYSSAISEVISLSDNKTQLLEQISQLPHPRDGTQTALGLARMNILFKDEARSGVPKIGIVITDGLSKNPQATEMEASRLKDKLNVNMFAVGITNSSDINELSKIASLDRNILTIDIFDDLEHILDNVVRMFCPLPECVSLDILTVVDGSDSISATDFVELKQSLKNLVRDLDIGNSGSRFGLILYSNNISEVIQFTNNETHVLMELDSLTHSRDGTETALALMQMIAMFNSLGRSSNQRIGIVITDGQSRYPNRTKFAAADAKSNGINMFAVGVTNRSNAQELIAIATTGQVFKANNFLQLSRSLMEVVRKACPANTNAQPSTTPKGITTADPVNPNIPDSSTSTFDPTTNNIGSTTTQGFDSTTTLGISSTTPQPGVITTPQRRDSTTPQRRDSTTPQRRDSTTPQRRDSTTPQRRDSTTPQRRDSTTPQRRDSTTPQPSVITTPQRRDSTTPQLSETTTPVQIDSTATLITDSTTRTTVSDDSYDSMLCDDCRMKNGIGFNSHNFSCTKFIQCEETLGGYIKAYVKDCPRGLFWDQDRLTCNYPEAVNCKKDRCYSLKLASYSAADNCRQYYSCISGVSHMKCCDVGSAYNTTTGRCEASRTCIDMCITSSVLQVCDKRPISGDPTSYEQEWVGIGWVKMPCAAGSAFNYIDCYCSLFYDATPNSVDTTVVPTSDGCKPIVYLPFNNDTSDQSGNNNYVHNEGVIVEDGAAYFDGLSGLRIPRFSNVDFGTKLTIKFRYRLDGVVNSQQALVTNSDCGKNGSIFILSNITKTTFGLGSEHLPVVSTSILSSNGWNAVEMKYSQGVLYGTVNSNVNNLTINGSITRSQYALQIGRGDQFANFKGWMDDVYVYMC